MSGTIPVTVDSGLWLPRVSLPAEITERLRRGVSFPNPEHAERVRLGLPTWGVPERLRILEEQGEDLRLPRGAAHLLKRLASEAGLAVTFNDRRTLPGERLPELSEPTLRLYQARAVVAAIHHTQGLIVAPCGAGKTRIGLGLIARLKTPTLVLVHTLDLLEQWRGQVREVFGIEAGIIGDGEEAPAPVTVALVQSLARKDGTWLDRLMAGLGMLILDEAHHVAASTFRGIVDRSPARYRFGLSATPERADGLTPLLQLFLGRTVATVTHDELEAAGVLVRPLVRTVPTDFVFVGQHASGDDYYRALLDAVKRDGARNALIARHVATEARAGHQCLVLTAHIDHCAVLRNFVEAKGVAAAVLTSDVPKARRVELLEAAKVGATPVIVATSLADEGLDWPALSRVFLAWPAKSRGRTLQRLGRLMRTSPGKPRPVLFDFLDERVGLLRRHHNERRRAYVTVLDGRNDKTDFLAFTSSKLEASCRTE